MRLKTVVGSLALLGLASHALAQTAPEQRIEITGSSIKRLESEGSLPVQTITRKQMEQQGIVTAEQLIATLNINGNSLTNLASNADVVAGAARGNNGATSADLRGQGASSTLVLLNGRRVAAYGLNGGVVDLNSIPFAAVERVEILKDGASAVYGTDAVGGVINFILRKDYKGLEMQAFTDVTQHGGGNISRLSAVGGVGDLDSDGYNVLVTVAHSQNQALRGDQRDFVNTFQSDRGLSVDTRGAPYATAFAIGSLNNALSSGANGTGPTLPGGTLHYNGINALNLPGQPGCASIDGQAPYDAVLWATPSAAFGCAWDTGRAAVLQQPVTNTSLVARGTIQRGDHQFYVEYTGSHVVSEKTFSPNQITSSTIKSSPFYNLAYPSTGSSYDQVMTALVGTFPSLAGNYAAGLPIAYRWRCMACGNRQIETTANGGRLLFGAEGSFGNWDYNAGISNSFSDSKSVLGGGYYFNDQFVPLLASGELNPFLLAGQSQTAQAMSDLAAASATGTELYGGKYTMTEVDAKVSGPIAKLPAGDLMAAFGTDLRTEKYKFNGKATDVAVQSNIFGAPFDSINTLDTVSRDVNALYTEWLIPVTKKLEATLAARYDHYTGFGSTTNPKASFRFTANDKILFRGSWGTGFRVPTFNQLFNGTTESPYSGKDIVDPATCPSLTVDPNVAGCAAVTPTILTGGKPDLGPEKSKQSSLGVVWAPSKNFSANLDWWAINRTGTIQSTSVSTLIANYALFPQNFIRDANGNLVSIDARWVNAGETVTKGLEFGFQANWDAMGGRWAANMDGSYLLDKKARLLTSSPFGPSEVGVFTRADDLGLRWKHTLTMSYSRGNWTGALTQIYRSGYADYVLPGVANGSVTPPLWKPDVSSYVLYNASVSYTGIKNLNLTFGIKNLADHAPPFSAAYDGNTGAGSSWEPRVADPRMRSFTFLVNYKFF